MRVLEKYRASVARALNRGLAAFKAAVPISLRAHAEKHFYLSAESSYVEQKWSAWPFQRAILACIGNDDIEEVDVQKSARVGYTKILLAAIAYFAEHRRRNQALWQPTDAARDDFVKTELEPMIRDVKVLHPIFPHRLARHKHNTLRLKRFLGSSLHCRGGTSGDSYRRISPSVGYLDEYSSFDSNVDGEGDPGELAWKRLEGATFPKFVVGSTPKLAGVCLMEKRAKGADARYQYQVKCAHCKRHHAITWGGKDETHGLKWIGRDPKTVRHMCPHCHELSTQADFLSASELGFWVGDDGTTIDEEGVFRDQGGHVIRPHRRVAFEVWTAYSPLVPWEKIVREFFEAYDKAAQGDEESLRTFWNTTLGRTWEGEIEKLEADELKRRAAIEGLPLPGKGQQLVPHRCLLLLAGCDTQDGRVEVGVWGSGRGGEMWTISHEVFFGNTAEEAVWLEVADYLINTRFMHESGTTMQIYASAIDTGGHNADAVYHFAWKHRHRRVYAIRGRPFGEKAIKDGAGKVDVDWKGRRQKNGVTLWHVGTNLAKDLFNGRLKIERPGPGYVHLSHELSDEWFRQLSAEVRVTRKSKFGSRTAWIPIRKRNEALDCAVYALWLEAHLNLARRSDAWWLALMRQVGIEPDAVIDVDECEEPVDGGDQTERPQPTALPTKTTPAKAGVSASVQPAQRRPPQRRIAASTYLRRR